MIEVLKQALDALETEVSIDWTNNDEFNASAEKMHDAITSLRQAIADAEKHEVSQEPVAWVDDERGVVDFNSYVPEPGTPLYTHPPQRTWAGLTTEQLATTDWSADFRAGALWAEAKLKQKNGYVAQETNS